MLELQDCGVGDVGVEALARALKVRCSWLKPHNGACRRCAVHFLAVAGRTVA